MNVLNSTQRAGLAATTATEFVKVGFKLAGPASNDTTSRAPVAGVAELRFGPAGQASADLLKFYLPGAVEVLDPTRTGAVVDVALGAQFTALATPAAVAAALKAAQVTQATAGATVSVPAHASC